MPATPGRDRCDARLKEQRLDATGARPRSCVEQQQQLVNVLGRMLCVDDASVAPDVCSERAQLFDACRRRAPTLLRKDDALGQTLQPREAGPAFPLDMLQSWTPLRDSAWLARPRSL